MNMMRKFAVLAVGGALSAAVCAAAGAEGRSAVDFVDPFIGTGGSGNCFPGPAHPFGLAQPGPDTDTVPRRYRRESGYRYTDEHLYGFSQNHLNGTGCASLGDVRLLPFVAGMGEPSADLHSAFDKRSEKAEVGFYSVALPDLGTRAEMTCTPRCSIYRFTYTGASARLLVDFQWGMVGDQKEMSTRVTDHASTFDENARRIFGRTSGWMWSFRKYAFAVEFDRPWTACEKLPSAPGEKGGRYVLSFDLKPGETLMVKTAVSTTDEAGAIGNLAAELPGWDFDGVRAACRAAWNDLLSRAEATGDETRLKIFYTALYHLMIQPSRIDDADGRYLGTYKPGAPLHDRDIHRAGPGGFYSTFSLWDTYRAANPLYTLLVPERMAAFVNSLVAQGEEQGMLPIWPVWGCETWCMPGIHAVDVIADACLKGVPGVDWERAYALVRRTLTEDHPKGARRIARWRELSEFGYIPIDRVKAGAVSSQLETCYNDACAARMAEALGKQADAAFFCQRAATWTNLFDRTTRLLRGRDSNGGWREPFAEFDCAMWKSPLAIDYSEGSAWHYQYSTLHMPETLIALQGGKADFVRRLDAFFGLAPAVDAQGRPASHVGPFGQYWHGNEPSHHIAYFYPFAGRPDRTQELVRRICDRLYSAKPDGLDGNEDCGQMSAWYVFSALGFYPFDPCGGDYVLGAPQLKKVSLRLGNRTFVVRAPNLSEKNKYVRSVTLNGKRVEGFVLKHADIVRGGELVFEMADTPAVSTVDAARRVFRPARWTRDDTGVRPVQPVDEAAWIGPKDADTGSFFRFRRAFESDGSELTFDVSADERFWLLLDGKLVALGPHRGMPTRWHYQTYAVPLAPGRHVLEATVMKLGDRAPIAQLSHRGGSFILKAAGAYDRQLTTGKAPWQVARLTGTEIEARRPAGTYGVGNPSVAAGTSFPYEQPPASAFASVARVAGPVRKSTVAVHTDDWCLFPSPLPDQRYAPCRPGTVKAVSDATNGLWTATDAADGRMAAYAGLIEGRPLVVPPRTKVSVLWDLDDYYCAYPELTASGGRGATVRWGWLEALRDAKGKKGDRNAFAGMSSALSFTDTFRLDGRADAQFTTPWWRCGRWCVLTVETADEPLTLTGVRLYETGYPLAVEADFTCDDATFAPIRRICQRAVRACTHEMLFDCPYIEQQMYPGDTRIQLLIQYALTRDSRMARSVMTLFDCARRDDGLVPMNFPTRGSQESATYTLCWALMFRDYLYWHDDADWLKTRLPGLRHTLSALAQYEDGNGLLVDLPGWSFTDWTWNFKSGVAPGCARGEGAGACNSLLYLLALQGAADVEAALGEPLFAEAWRARAARLKASIKATFWDEGRGMLANTAAKDSFSEHAQCLGVLGDVLTPDESRRALAAMSEARAVSRCSTYFAHYLFAAWAKVDRADLIRKRLSQWRAFVDWGARTTFETPDKNSRSDCHAWSACPEYHFQTTFAGVTPAAPLFAKVRVAPQPAGLRLIRAKTPCPQGRIETDLSFDGARVTGRVTLPGTLTGTFVWQGIEQPLVLGVNEIDVSGNPNSSQHILNNTKKGTEKCN